jgi:prepilin-type N-terminal cleavage/methylation domain-containing protein
MKTSKWTRKGFTLVELLVVISIIVALAALSMPQIMKQLKKMDMTEAINNCRQVHLALFEFQEDNGNYPDADTAADNDDLSGFSGNTSNKMLGQLIAGGYTTSEKIFYAKGGNPSGNKKPDDVISPPSKILEAGEVGFAYVLVSGEGSNGARGLSSSDNGGLPILCAPVQTGGSDAVFKPDPFGGKGVWLRVDGSVRNERLNMQSNKVKVSNKTLFETGDGTVWGTTLTPKVLLPE